MRGRDETRRADLREEQRREKCRAERRALQREEQRREKAEEQMHRVAEAQRRRSTKPKNRQFRAKRMKEKRVGTCWEVRGYIESAPRRVRVVAIATRPQPRRGAHLAYLAPLI